MKHITTTTIKNDSIKLPKTLAQSWRGREVTILMDKDRVIVQPLDIAWDRYEKKLRQAKKRVSGSLIDEAVRWARRRVR